MRWLKTTTTEIFALFVDDGAFAPVILVWLVVIWLALPVLHLPPIYRGPILFGGLAAILIESAGRAAGRRSEKK